MTDRAGDGCVGDPTTKYLSVFLVDEEGDPPQTLILAGVDWESTANEINRAVDAYFNPPDEETVDRKLSPELAAVAEVFDSPEPQYWSETFHEVRDAEHRWIIARARSMRGHTLILKQDQAVDLRAEFEVQERLRGTKAGVQPPTYHPGAASPVPK